MKPEEQIQRAVFQHIRARGFPGVFAFHVPMGGYRRKTEAAILKAMGAVAGVPDIIIVYRGTCHGLELKAWKGKVSNQQRSAMNALEIAGARVAVAYTIDEALITLESWGILKRDQNNRSVIHRVPELMETQDS